MWLCPLSPCAQMACWISFHFYYLTTYFVYGLFISPTLVLLSCFDTNIKFQVTFPPFDTLMTNETHTTVKWWLNQGNITSKLSISHYNISMGDSHTKHKTHNNKLFFHVISHLLRNVTPYNMYTYICIIIITLSPLFFLVLVIKLLFSHLREKNKFHLILERNRIKRTRVTEIYVHMIFVSDAEWKWEQETFLL